VHLCAAGGSGHKVRPPGQRARLRESALAEVFSIALGMNGSFTDHCVAPMPTAVSDTPVGNGSDRPVGDGNDSSGLPERSEPRSADSEWAFASPLALFAKNSAKLEPVVALNSATNDGDGDLAGAGDGAVGGDWLAARHGPFSFWLVAACSRSLAISCAASLNSRRWLMRRRREWFASTARASLWSLLSALRF